ncbi:MAG: hypothetical protein F7C34_01255 [Desulfurococcales archaeon]|nr:hypothetical protein [Desulfurococcales archaeon]
MLALIVGLTLFSGQVSAVSSDRVVTAYYAVQRVTVSGPVGVGSTITGYSRPSLVGFKYAIEGDRLVLLSSSARKDAISFIINEFSNGRGRDLGPYGQPQVIISTSPSDSAVCTPEILAYTVEQGNLYAEGLVCNGLVIKVIINTRSGTYLARLLAIEGVSASSLPGAEKFPSIYAKVLLIALSILIVAEAVRQVRAFRAEKLLAEHESSSAEYDLLA